MARWKAAPLLALAACAPLSAHAEEREFCAERPGQTTPPCTLERGRAMIETGIAQWTRESDPTLRTDTLTLGSSTLRLGLASRLEAQVGWTPLGIVWEHDTASGNTARRTSGGDATLGLTYGLAGANGPVALQGFVSLPTGGAALGTGDWGAGLRLPAAVELGGVEVGLTPEIDAAVNGSGSGRHLAYGGAAGVGVPLAERLQLGIDVALFRDEDPEGASILANVGASLAWQAGANTQFDVGGTVGLNAASPDAALYFGIARRF
ncbi:MAG: transporter [Novosphingobium sp.]